MGTLFNSNSSYTIQCVKVGLEVHIMHKHPMSFMLESQCLQSSHMLKRNQQIGTHQIQLSNNFFLTNLIMFLINNLPTKNIET